MHTIAHVRPGASTLAEWRSRFGALGAEVDTTPWTAAAMGARLRALRPDHVFALLGTTRSRAARERLAAPYEAVDYGLTALLLAGARDAECTPCFSYLSAIGADAGARNPYLAVRGRLEQELVESGLPFLIARPAFVTGADRDERRPTERVAAVVLDGALALVAALGGGGLRARYASLTGRALAQGMVALALAHRHGRVVADAAVLRAAPGTGAGA